MALIVLDRRIFLIFVASKLLILISSNCVWQTATGSHYSSDGLWFITSILYKDIYQHTLLQLISQPS